MNVESYDAVVIGGGPAGSTCARELHRAGLHVTVLDRAHFPRDKVCAGWITPAVITLLDLDVDDYRRGRVFQPITAFRTALLTGSARDTAVRPDLETRYPTPVSFGIRRYEFDDYLLRRCGADLRCGEAVSSLRRRDDGWLINGTIATPVLVGAGGHFCPAARWLARESASRTGRGEERRPVVAAIEMEVPLTEEQLAQTPEPPVLRFYDDLSGYGWSFRKGTFLNVGLGRRDARELPRQARCLLDTLVSEQLVPEGLTAPLRGHAYLLANSSPRGPIGDGLLLAGDAAGLADAHSGEGIRPAIESGLLAAATILATNVPYDRTQLEPYRQTLRHRFGTGTTGTGLRPRVLPRWLVRSLANGVMRSPWLTRHLVLDRWFLGRHRPALDTHGGARLSGGRLVMRSTR